MGIEYNKEGSIATFTINQPETLNVINMEAVRELCQAMVDFRDDPRLLVGIITGSGEKVFSAGADMKDTLIYMKEHRDDPGAIPPAFWRGLEIWKPLIAAINGTSMGGGTEILLACDLRIAAENVRIGLPEVGVGLIPGWGGTQRLPRVIPWAKAAEMLLMGSIIDAEEAYRIGLVNKVVPLDQLMPTAQKWAETICRHAPLAVRAAKEAMVRGSSMSLEDGLKLESSLENYLFGTEDFTEGINAFLEKRKPNFKEK
jgi:enoyl-CoA hydratase/carnithine racemase